MYKLILQFSKKFVENIAELDEEALTLPSSLISFMKILQSLLDLTYLKRIKGSYIFLLSILIRPQLYFNTELMQYCILSLHIIYFIVIFIKIPKRKIFALHGILMRTNYLNFCLEISNFPICLVSQPLSFMISAFNQFIVLEALDVKIKNFQQTKVRNIFNLIFLLQITISLIDFYQVDKLYIYMCIIFHQVLYWIHSTNELETAIHIYTLFITICDIFQIADQSSFIIIFPFLYKIHLRFKQQSSTEQEILPNNNEPKEKIIYISHLLISKQYLKSLQQLSSLQYTNIILNTKKENLKKRCIKQILLNMQGEERIKTNFFDSYQKIIESEEQFMEMQVALKELITEKMILLKSFQIEKFQLFFKFLEKMNKFEQDILSIDLEYSNQKLRKIILFYFSEISNDFHQARIYSYQNKEVQMEDYDKHKLSYIMSVYNTKLQITSVSKNAVIQNIGGFSIDRFIPAGIREFHSILVDEFVQKGYSKFIERFDSVFILKEYDKIMTSIDFGLIINATDKLQFVAFFQPSSEQKMALILDSFFQITCISESLANCLNISSFDKQYIGSNITQMIPKFQENSNYQEDLDLIVQQDQEETVYLVTINITSRIIENDCVYSIVYFQSVRRQAKQKTLTSSQYHTILDPTSLNFETKRCTEEEIVVFFNVPQEDQVNIPYEQSSNHQLSIQFMKQEAIFDENKILESPISCQHKLIMKPTLSTKLRKQQSQNIEEENFCTDDTKQQNEVEKKNFLQDYYKQKIYSINKFYLLFILSLVVACLFYIYQTAKLNQDIQSLINDIDILDFAQLCFQPLENNLLIIFSVSEYQLYYVMNFITAQQLIQLVQFPTEQVVVGYKEIFNNFNSLFSQNIFQSILDENIIQISQYTNSSNLDSYNVTLRKAFGILLEFQYDELLDFQKNGRVNSDTSHIYYLFKNYIPLKTLVTDLNTQLLNQTIVITQQHQDFVFQLLMISLLFVSIPYFISYFYFIKIKDLIDCYYNILLQIPQHVKESQITTLKYFNSQITQDCDFILRYQYNEGKFRNEERSNQNQKRTKTSNSLKFSALSWKLGYMILYFIILTKALITYYLSKEYFSGYREIAKFYISLSDLSISITSMYSAREVLYFRESFPYLEKETIEYLYNLIEESLNKTQNFLEKEAIQAISNNVIITEAFSQYYENILKENLCSQLNEELLTLTQSFCEQLFGGNMKKGLIAVLTGIVNTLRSEMSFSQFSQRSSISIYDLEGPFLISQIISQLFHKMKEYLLIETAQFVEIVNLISIVLLSLLTALILFSKQLIFNYIRMKIEISKRFISFIPLKMLLLDEGLERYVKNLTYKNNIH